MKRPVTAIAALLTVSFLLAACRTTPYRCTDPLGCLEIPPGSPVVIGVLLATSNAHAAFGSAALQSVEKAAADQGELLGHPIQLLEYGTDCSAGSALSAASELTTRTDLAVVIGPTCNEEADSARPVLLNAGVPLLGPLSDDASASTLAAQVFTAIQHIGVQMPDQTLILPRQALFQALHLSP